MTDAIREVITLTRETPIKGPIHNYDPLNYDRMYADEYGGYGNVPGSSRPSRESRRGGDRGDYDSRLRSDRSRSNGRREGGSVGNPFINPWANEDRGFNSGGNDGFLGGGAGSSFGGSAGAPFGTSGGFAAGNAAGIGGAGSFGAAGPMAGGANFSVGGFGSQGPMSGFGGAVGGGFGGAAGNFNATTNPSTYSGGAMPPGTFPVPPSNMVNGMTGAPGGAGNAFTGSVNNGSNTSITGTLPEGHDPKNSTQVSIPKDVSSSRIRCIGRA